MYRLLFIVALAVLVGCKKKAVETGTGGDGAVSDTTPYTIKIAKRDVGTKWQIIDEKKVTITAHTTIGKELHTEEEKSDYVEAILASDKDKPTKLTRAYRSAQKAGKSGTFFDLSYAGKVLLIEKRGDLYSFTVDGRPLSQEEAAPFLKDFKPTRRDDGSDKSERWLPKTAVRIGEKWDIPLDEEDGMKAMAVGRLTKVYRDASGRQCGVIVAEGEMTLPKKADAPEKMSILATYDGAIDGSSWHSKRTFKLTAEWLANDPKHGRVAAGMEVIENTTKSVVE